jgi:hypothetical protein
MIGGFVIGLFLSNRCSWYGISSSNNVSFWLLPPSYLSINFLLSLKLEQVQDDRLSSTCSIVAHSGPSVISLYFHSYCWYFSLLGAINFISTLPICVLLEWVFIDASLCMGSLLLLGFYFFSTCIGCCYYHALTDRNFNTSFLILLVEVIRIVSASILFSGHPEYTS